MNGAWMLLQGLLFAAVVAGMVYHGLSAWCTAAVLRRRASAHTNAPPISILKPLRGADVEAAASFASFCRQEYSEFELVFGVLEADDPALPVVEALRQEYPAVPVQVVV